MCVPYLSGKGMFCGFASTINTEDMERATSSNIAKSITHLV